jgi:hypothetical protein
MAPLHKPLQVASVFELAANNGGGATIAIVPEVLQPAKSCTWTV